MPINPPREVPPTEKVQVAVKAQLPLISGLLAIVATAVVFTPAAPIAVPLAFLAGSLARRK